ncbi:MAG: hypothetical protein DI534_03335 [Leifsonia xyli]|nr:MAG: hypothetical protein DI534_03335 [Leifsonia xyli]
MSGRGIGWRGKLGLIAGIVTFSLLAGAGASWAYWTAQATSTTTLGAANLTITTANFSSLAKTFTNDSLQHTGSVTVANTTSTSSTTRGDVTLTFSATTSTSPDLRSKFAVQVWLQTTGFPCTNTTPGPILASGTWGTSFDLALTGASGFTAGESRSYCVRTTIAKREDVATSGGTLTLTPAFAGKLQIGSFVGTATAATTAQTTSSIYSAPTVPISTTAYYWLRPNLSSSSYPKYCADVNGGTPNPGISVIAFACKKSGADNQVWRFNAVSGRAGYFTISTGVNTTNFVDGTSGTLMTPTASGGTNQIWFPQLIDASTSRFQIVSDASGLCWVAPTGTGQNLGDITLAACNGGVAAQQFIMSRVPTFQSCNYSNSTYTLTFTAAASTTYRLYDGGTSTLVGSGSSTTTDTSGAGVITFTRNDLGSNGTYNIDLVDAYGTLVGTGTATRGVNFFQQPTGSCAISDMT